MTEDTSLPSLSDQPEAVDPDDNAHRPNQQSAVMAEISLAHLHPGIRHIALADDAVRLQAMRAKRWITHPPALEVLAALREAFDQPAGDRMENLPLIAESGMGKTMLLQKFQRDHALALDAATGTQPHPVVLALMAEAPSEEAFFLQILKAVGAPFDLLRRRHRLSLRETTFRLLRELGTRMLMIDEINSILVGSARQQRQFLQLVRFLSNELRVAIVCAGVPEARVALLSGPQLRSRVAEISLGPELQDFVSRLVQGLPLRRPSPVDSVKLRRLLIERSGGITGRFAARWSVPARRPHAMARSASTYRVWMMRRCGGASRRTRTEWGDYVLRRLPASRRSQRRAAIAACPAAAAGRGIVVMAGQDRRPL